jgi:capsular polysaccharide biosynthesis protein
MTAQSHEASVPAEISLVEAVWRYRVMSLIIVLVCALAAVSVTQLLFRTASATARFAISDPTNKNSLNWGVVSSTGFSTFTAQRAVFAQSAPVLIRAGQILVSQGGPRRSLGEMRSRVHTEPEPEGGVVHVTATGETMPIAASTANSVIKAYQQLTQESIKAQREAQLKSNRAQQKVVATELAETPARTRQSQTLTSLLSKLQQQESELVTEAAKDNDGVQFVDAADPAAKADSKLMRNGVIGIAVGVLLATVASFLRASSPGASQPGRGGGGRGGALRPPQARRRAEEQADSAVLARAGTPWSQVDSGEHGSRAEANGSRDGVLPVARAAAKDGAQAPAGKPAAKDDKRARPRRDSEPADNTKPFPRAPGPELAGPAASSESGPKEPKPRSTSGLMRYSDPE